MHYNGFLNIHVLSKSDYETAILQIITIDLCLCLFLCNRCSKEPFPTAIALKEHLRKEHELFYCDLCTENLKVSHKRV